MVTSTVDSKLSAIAPDVRLIRDALAQHYVTHGLPLDGGASNPWFDVHIGTFKIRLPNPPARRRAVLMHDINHIVTGYNTTFSEGEMSIAAFEVGAGCGRLAIVWFINLSLLALAVFVHPRAAFAGFVRGRRTASIYSSARDAATLAAMSVEGVRALLRVDATDSQPRFTDRILFAIWALVAIIVFLAPLAIVLSALWALVHALLR